MEKWGIVAVVKAGDDPVEIFFLREDRTWTNHWNHAGRWETVGAARDVAPLPLTATAEEIRLMEPFRFRAPQ